LSYQFTTQTYLRCVAGGIEKPLAAYRCSWNGSSFAPDAAGPVVCDDASKLAWEYAPPTTYVTSASAQTRCAGALHGATGWLVPSVAHYGYVTDFEQASIVLPMAGFSPTLTGFNYYWGLQQGVMRGVYSATLSPTAIASAQSWCVRPLP
jgi:hypothetical protein